VTVLPPLLDHWSVFDDFTAGTEHRTDKQTNQHCLLEAIRSWKFHQTEAKISNA
jgi:hypothetical protein